MITYYLDQDEYAEFGGTLEDTAFEDVRFQAQAVIDWYTFNRLQNDTEFDERVKRCLFRLMQIIQQKMEAMATVDPSGESTNGFTAGIASQSNDGVSISYNVVSASEVVEGYKDELKECVEMYLQGVVNQLGRKVLYRGLYPGE